MPVRVECYSGYRGEQEPVAFWLGDQRFAVIAIDDRWTAPDHRGFRVRADDGSVHVLRYDTTCDAWEVAGGGARGRGGLSL
jgi:hypothetical protein